METNQIAPYTTNPPPSPPNQGGGGRQLKKAAGPLAVLGALLAKFKLLLLPVLKFFPIILNTGGTMILSIGLYAMAWGWWFALGFVLLILVHECGHLIAARRLGLEASAPVFIPFLGAYVALKNAPRNSWIEAQVGIGGPLLGAAGAAVCYAIFLATKNPLFSALAYMGFLLNLFNLMPISPLDGGRIVTALSPLLWLAGLIGLGLLMFANFNLLSLLIILVSVPRLFLLFRTKSVQEARYFEATAPQRRIVAGMYFGLIALLILGMVATYIDMHRG